MIDPYRMIGPLLRRLPPECAHRLSIRALASGLPWPGQRADDPMLSIRLWDRDFSNPLGLAAGYDKDAEVPRAALRLGFAFVEIGTVTPRPQPGNPRPRLFRLIEDEAVINRMGFNSGGLEAAAGRLGQLRADGRAVPGFIGANVGKNRDSEDAAADYAAGAARLAPLVDYLVINVSSPNTPGLRELQRRSALLDLIAEVRRAIADVRPYPPLLVKVAPDLSPDERGDIAAVAEEAAVDGLIIG
ncbi:MAG: dihydroorotate dehydrogenase (quinone), partial [Alphaproteobacteria bacterium]